MDVTLVLVQSDGSRRDVPMKRARVVIGRKKQCDVRIPVASVSREHCEIRVEDSKLLLRDLGSSNGSYVNRERVQEVQLSAGDLVGIGPAVFVIRIAGDPAEVDAKRAYAQGAPPRPVGASAGPVKARPAAPGAKPGAPRLDDDDLDIDANEDSSLADFDFNFDDEEEDKKKL